MVEELLKSKNSDDVILGIRILTEELQDRRKIKERIHDYRLNIDPEERIDIFIGSFNFVISYGTISFYYYENRANASYLNHAKILKF